jgi:hypothetical protein
LVLADEILEEFYDVQRPWDFEAPDYVQYVAQTSSQECEETDITDTGGAGGGGSGGGGGLDDGVVDLCFTKDALVSMEDGRMVPIDTVEVGDLVSTGFPGEIGRVTEVLVHNVDTSGKTAVTVISTGHGDLIGTPSHPIFINGEWMEMQEAIELGIFDQHGIEAKNSAEIVDVFYNLEIDGDKLEESSHSYVVNGIIASGLGDNEVLNTLFARQNGWKTQA